MAAVVAGEAVLQQPRYSRMVVMGVVGAVQVVQYTQTPY